MFTKSFIALATLQLALAIPTSYEEAGSTLWLNKRSANLLTTRDTIADLPTCKTDPSYAVGPSRWKDGEGTYLGSDCDSDSKSKGWHCWTDYYSTGTQARYDGWVPSGNEVDCASTNNCNDIKASQAQTCKTIGWSVGVTVSQNFEYSIGVITGNTGVSVSTEVSGSKQVCSSQTDSTTCSWSDQECHSIWKAERVVTQLGYIRRSCNTGRKGVNMPEDKQKRADGYYTVGMQDYAFDLPTPNVIIGCAAMCGDTKYPHPSPPSDTTVTPPLPTVGSGH